MCALYAIVACRVGEAGESSVLQAMLTLASMYRKGEACWRVSCFHLIYVSSWLFLTSSRSASFIRCFFFVPFYVCWRRAWHQLLSGRAVLEIQQRHFVAFSRRGTTAEQRGTSHAVICRCRISDNTRCCLWFMIYEFCVLGYHEILGGDRSDGAWYFTFVCTVVRYSSHGHVLFGYLAFSEISCNRQLRRATLKPPMSLGGFSGSNAKWSMRHRWFPLRLGVMFLSGEGTLPDEAFAVPWNALFSPHLRKY